MSTARVSFPHLANYYLPLEHLMTRGVGVEYIKPPPITKRTLELGTKYSPDYVCAPFKINLGCFLEAIDEGADTLMQVGGACRLGYYGELHEQLIRDLGHEVTFINLARANYSKPQTLYGELKRSFPQISLPRLTPAFLTALRMVESMDAIDNYMRQHIGFEREKGSFEHVYADYLDSLSHVEGASEMRHIASHYLRRVRAIPLDMPKKPLRVGMVGEYYSIMDPFASHNIEKELAQKGVVVERWMNVTNTIFHFTEKDMLEKIRGYARYNMGATSMSTIEQALTCAKKGYDGIIHLKSVGCTPEIDSMPVLQNISHDYKIPILYFSFDTQTADAGIQTRLEAFYDMMTMKKGW